MTTSLENALSSISSADLSNHGLSEKIQWRDAAYLRELVHVSELNAG